MLWNNVRDAFPTEIVQMYQTLRSAGTLSYANVSKRFTDHQAKWSEAIFNEDAWFKYIDPLTSPDPGKDPTAVYLPMLQGSKAEQRKWWLYNRFRYMDSKWNAGDALSDVIQLRGYAKADITVTPYADIYPTIKYGSYLVAERGHRNTPSLLPCPLDAVNDTEIYIYSASQLASVGDLSPLKVGFADFSKASRLQSVKVGSGDAGYVNQNLTELSVGNSRLLQSVDARNCAALTGAVDLSGAANIKTVLLQGTSVTSVLLPVGGVLQTLRLPATIANLTIRDQRYITLFSIEGGEYDTITTLRIENCGDAIPIFDILEAMSAGGRVRLLGMSTEISTIEDVAELYDRFDLMSGLDENGDNLDGAVVSGTISGVAEARRKQLNDLVARYPNVTIECAYVKEGSIVRFYNGDTLLQYIDDAPNGQTAQYTGPTPVHPTNPTANEFIGWFPSNVNIADETNCYAQYHDTESLVVKYLEDRLTELDWDGTADIRDYAFYHSTGLKTLTVRGGTIGRYAFGYVNLDTINLVDVDTASAYAFYGATFGSVETMMVDTVQESAFSSVTVDDATFHVGTAVDDSFIYVKGNALRVHANTLSGRTFYGATVNLLDITCPVGAAYRAVLGYCKSRNIVIRCDGDMFNTTDRIDLDSTYASSDEGAIYVPSEHLDTYRSKSYSTNPTIVSIDQYPLPSDRSTISDSWGEIAAASSDGTYATRYSIGDKKLLELSDGNHVYMHLVAMDADELSDGSGSAHMTWLAGDVVPYSRAMMSSSDNVLDGWAGSGVRSYLNGTFASLLPSEVADAIKTVRKRSRCYESEDVAYCQTTDDAIWIPCHSEIMYSVNPEESGSPSYRNAIGTTYASGGTVFNASRNATYVWLRTLLYHKTNYSDGSVGYDHAFEDFRSLSSTSSGVTYSETVMFGFCL